MSEAEPTASPQLRIVKGNPSPAELAALVAVLVGRARGRAAADVTQASGSAWTSYWRKARVPARAGRGAWRASGLPR